mmetsp:Transcript_177413/g.431548  ORF Transcript_177413/g.431548 Transcript_177413/m.431548 type:complete len:259 (-) Transcript_177413:271-1047(-)
MPAEQGRGGSKIAMIVGGALAMGIAIGVLCVVSRGSGLSGQANEAVQKERSNFLHGAEGNTARSRVIIRTPAPEPRHSEHQEAEQHVEHHQDRHREEKHNEERREKDHREREHQDKETHEDRHREKEHDDNDDIEKERHEHNQTRKEHHGHEHKDCEGGPHAACKCMLKCEVFGGDVSMCHSGDKQDHNETRTKVDKLIASTMLSHRNMCDGMRCIRDCAQELGCLDEKVMTDCSIVKKNYADNKMDSDPDCELSCES